MTWDATDEAQFKDWAWFNSDVWEDEAIARIKKKKELKGAGGGGESGCCVIG